MSRQQKSSLAPSEHKGLSRAQAEVQMETVVGTVPHMDAQEELTEEQALEEMAPTAEEEAELAAELDDEDGESADVPSDAEEGAISFGDEDDQQDLGAEKGSTWTENDAPRLSDAELGKEPVELRPVELQVRRDYSLTVTSLEHRLAEIEKLAKKTEDEGYPREARVMKADAERLREAIIPEFKPFIELPLIQPEQLQWGIRNKLRGVVHRAITHAAKAGDVRADVDEAERILIDQLAIRVGSMARSCVERGYAAGIAARESDPDALASKALDCLTTKGEG